MHCISVGNNQFRQIGYEHFKYPGNLQYIHPKKKKKQNTKIFA